MLPARTAVLCSLLIGVSLEVGTAALTGRREPWDAALFWQLGMPLAMLAAATVGYLAPRQGWKATVLVGPAQVVTMMVKSGELGNLWPLALVFSLLLGLPFLLAAWVASRFRART